MNLTLAVKLITVVTNDIMYPNETLLLKKWRVDDMYYIVAVVHAISKNAESRWCIHPSMHKYKNLKQNLMHILVVLNAKGIIVQ